MELTTTPRYLSVIQSLNFLLLDFTDCDFICLSVYLFRWGTPSYAQVLHLPLHSGIIFGSASEPYNMKVIESGSEHLTVIPTMDVTFKEIYGTISQL